MQGADAQVPLGQWLFDGESKLLRQSRSAVGKAGTDPLSDAAVETVWASVEISTFNSDVFAGSQNGPENNPP